MLNFTDYNLKPSLFKAINLAGYKSPTEIQHQTLSLLDERPIDLIAQAQTGTGKTAAFGLPLISRLSEKSKNIEALILAPTRELAQQIQNEMAKFTKYDKIESYPILGGASYAKQQQAINSKKPQIIIGTPGRVRDLIRKGTLNFKFLKFFVLDEADEMLNMGFLEEIQDIMTYLPEQRTTWMFSATMSKSIINLANKHFNEPKHIKVEKKSLEKNDIEQSYYLVKPKQKQHALWRLLNETEDMYGIVFCKTRIDSQTIGENLQKKGISVSILNGDMNQAQRERSMRLFKKKVNTIMVCTDVAARGIDVNNLTHVFNYHVPHEVEAYVHRIGRTGRAGAKGKAISFITPQDTYSLSRIEKALKIKIEQKLFSPLSDLKKDFSKQEAASLLLEETADKLPYYSESYEDFSQGLASADKDKLIKLLFTKVAVPKLENLNSMQEIENVTFLKASEDKPKSSRRSFKKKPRRLFNKKKRRRS